MAALKITVVGDPVVGKTCLLSTYVTGHFPENYVPTVFEHYVHKITVDDVETNMTLWDTAGQEDYERLRSLSYPNTKCFVLCFAVDRNLGSYENISEKWLPELKHYCPNIPIVLVATKIDLRDNPSIKCHTFKEGLQLKKKIKARSYKESSALRNEGLEDIFVEAVRIIRRKPKCIFL